jgi:hypothetical protein
MPLIVKDRVREGSVTSGTGTITLTGAVLGFQTFSSAIGNGNTTYYAITESGTANFEVGLGTVGAGTLTRDTVLESSNSGSLVNFGSAAKDVFCTYPAERATYQDSTLTAYAPQVAASNGLVLNSNTVSANYTIPTNYNAVSVGTITINSGVTVTVPSGSNWKVL